MTTIASLDDLNVIQCRSWAEITEAFEWFPRPKLDFDENGEIKERVWIFRGHADHDRLLKPSLEWAAEKKSTSWAALELMFLWEFQAKAPLHTDRRNLPQTESRLDWLALMQHYGVPTRLLDFTSSPYVALYFALRSFRQACKAHGVSVLAINGQTLMQRAKLRTSKAEKENRSRINAQRTTSPDPISLASFATDHDEIQWNRVSLDKLTSLALALPSDYRRLFNAEGFACVAQPTIQNPRLSCQQGIFLLNGANEQSLQGSLLKMMRNESDDWIRLFKIQSGLLPEIERRLFQMNVHELSLFPDLEGLAGFLRQKASIHWDPADPSDEEDS